MFRNYFVIACRIAVRSKLFSLINITGLGLGLASCVLIGYYIQQELTYDRYHPQADRIYRVATNFLTSNGGDRISASPDRLALQLQAEFPEIRNYSRMNPFHDPVVRYNGENIREEGFAFADPQTLQVFRYTFIEGNAATALNDPNNVVVSRSIALKYFNTEHALGKSLEIDDRSYTITGIFQDLPKNTSLPQHALIGSDFAKDLQKAGWSFNCKTFLLVSEDFDPKAFDEKLKVFTKKHFEDLEVAFELEPLTNLRFSTGVKFDGPKGNINYMFGFAFAGGVLLLIIIFNYINLSALLTIRRAKEVGMRKISGAQTKQLILQFLSESLLILSISGILAFGFIQLILPLFTLITGKTMDFTWDGNLRIVIGLLVALVSIVLIALIYPASLLARIRSVTMLKGNFSIRDGNNRPRNLLMTMQFGLCTAVLISLGIILAQMQFIRNKELGYSRQDIVSIKLPTDSTSLTRLNGFSNLLSTAGFKEQSYGSYSASLFEADQIRETITVPGPAGKVKMQVNTKLADEHFTDLMKMRLSSGKSFKDYSPAQWSRLIMVNETFLRTAGWQSAIGREVTFPNGLGTYQVIGVLEDFHFASLHTPIEPVILQAKDFRSNVYQPQGDVASIVYLKISPDNLEAIRGIWRSVFPDSPFDYSFLDDAFEKQYADEANMMALLLYFTILSMIVTGLGLYSIAAYQAEVRTKEIGIRKILGANLQSLFLLLSKDNLRHAILGGGLGIALAWKLSDLWLENFSYKIDVNIVSLMLPAVLMVLFSAVIIGYSVFHVTSANPADSLRNE
ncbi:MAG TPA: ABC transporter permease [Ohtaekwangia sp.]|uniref:ABC transporter permease n=1 Tax=Ohtaekwangia sp. TaxID=2066019 RepID=UPI002F933F60